MTLRCRRCNVIRRPSHARGGLTFLTAEFALMWLLFYKKPKNYLDFKKLCREYGLTMADIRFQESWAMAKWLKNLGLYEIVEDKEDFISEDSIPIPDDTLLYPPQENIDP